MKNPNLSQIFLFLRNDKDFYLSNLINKEEFIFYFINHLIEHFDKMNFNFKILEPLLDPSIELEQQTTLSVDSIEVGELHLLCNSIFDEASLVYYSPSGLMEVFLLEYEVFDDYKLSDYILLLNEFSSLLISEKLLYEKIKSV